jgi:arabinofuranosyltransferase
MRYAENLARGKGFVYNTNEYVEGFSNPLWVFLLSIPSALSASYQNAGFSLLWTAKALSYLFFLGSLRVLYILTCEVYATHAYRKTIAVLVLSAAVSSAPLVAWSVSGLETTLCMFSYTYMSLIAYRIIRQASPEAANYIVMGLVIGISIVIRPETPLYSVFVLIVLFRYPHTRTNLFRFVLPVILIIGAAIILWRVSTFDEILPNTFYAKSNVGLRGHVLGIKYFLGGVGIVFGMFLIFIAYFIFSRIDTAIRKLFFAFSSATALFIFFSGGDWMPAYRFFIPILPLCFLSIVMAFIQFFSYLSNLRTLPRLSRVQFAVFVFAIFSANAFGGRMMIRNQISVMQTGFSVITGHTCPSHAEVVEWLSQHAPEQLSVATGEAGFIGYSIPSMRLIDLGQLNDKHLAKDKYAGRPFDVEYVLSKDPDYIILYRIDSVDERESANPNGDFSPKILADKHFKRTFHLEHKTSYLYIWARNPSIVSK